MANGIEEFYYLHIVVKNSNLAENRAMPSAYSFMYSMQNNLVSLGCVFMQTFKFLTLVSP